MLNQLENLCEEKGIKVEFISHKFIDDASELKNSQPVIKVHRTFRECPVKVATAIVEICTGEGYSSQCIEIIESYLIEKFGPIGIKIQAPKVIVKKPIEEEIKAEYKEKEELNNSEEEQGLKEEDLKEEPSVKVEVNVKEEVSVKENPSVKEEQNRTKYPHIEADPYIEAEISSMDVTNMKGQQKKLNYNEALELKEQDILDLDIIVQPSLHK